MPSLLRDKLYRSIARFLIFINPMSKHRSSLHRECGIWFGYLGVLRCGLLEIVYSFAELYMLMTEYPSASVFARLTVNWVILSPFLRLVKLPSLYIRLELVGLALHSALLNQDFDRTRHALITSKERVFGITIFKRHGQSVGRW